MGDDRPLRLGWFSTGRGEGSLGLLQAALDAIDTRELNATVAFVFCNRERGQAAGSDRFIDLAESRGIPLVALSSRSFRRERDSRKWSELREEFDRAVIELLRPYDVDISVNAGYMLIAPLLCRVHKMINLHPALPGGPIGMWQPVIWELIEQRAEETGAMVHVVTEEVDGGPVLSFCRFGIRGPDMVPHWQAAGDRDVTDLKGTEGEALPLFQAIRQSGLVRERPLLVETLKAIAGGEIDVANAREHGAVDLTDQVELAAAAIAAAG